MDAHEWNESLNRIISTIAEMIDLLKNESRRWATSPIFSTPLPSPAAPSPQSTPISTPKFTTFSQPTASPKPSLLRASLLAPSGPKAAPLSAYATTQAPYSSLNVTISFKDSRAWKISKYDSEQLLKSCGYSICNHLIQVDDNVLKASNLLMYLVVFEEPFDIIEESHKKRVSKSGAQKHEWRPPWCSVKGSPSAAGRTEWRPPWRSHFRS
ncbi:hypothetical protein HanIR_Chr05g0247861 [Helianthus annuus]|nr:hypothetical protein HanIR_Chr05g0247861 [Helianthus annuus]